ncbi:hypothetical protein [Novosphingobium sp. 28-62-57]|nr:hypothetical protein [Novosphingobium sp. 28-62-57]
MPKPMFRSYRHLAAHVAGLTLLSIAVLSAIPFIVTAIGAFVK